MFRSGFSALALGAVILPGIVSELHATPTDPVAWLKAEGNALDATNFGNNGVVNGSVPYVPGQVGNAFSFSGVGTNSVRIANSASLQTSLLSVEYWIYFNNIQNSVNVTKRSSSGAGDAWQVGISYSAGNFNLQFVGYTSSGLFDWYSPALSSPVGVWTHVAATYDGSTVRGYVNGAQVLTQAVALQLGSRNADVFVGAYPNGVFALDGKVDELSIYNRALSAAEVQAIYQAGSAGKTTPTLAVTGVSPANGSTLGGTSVTITGTNFTGATGVTFGGTAATGVTVVNATTITATAPAGPAGVASVVVTTPSGSSTANSLFTYGAPNVAPGFSLPTPSSDSWTAWVPGLSEAIVMVPPLPSVWASANGGTLAAAVYGGAILISTDGGATWIDRASSRNWVSLTSSADATKLAAVETGGQIYTSANGGVNWTVRESNRAWKSITSSADGTRLAAVESGGQIYTSIDSGISWTPRNSNRNWSSVASSADGTKLAAVVNNGQIHTSTDGGVNWTARESNRAWVSIASSADGTKLAAAAQGGQIYTSTDSGATWTPRESNRTWGSFTISADGTRMAAAVSGGQIHTSTDSGITWAAQATTLGWTSIAMSANGEKLVAGINAGQLYLSARIPYNLSVPANSGTSTTPNFATNISPGPVAEAGQTVTFQVSNNNNALFTTQPAISSNGTLTFTPASNSGVATVTVIATDNGSNTFGGTGTSIPRTFAISVSPTVTNVSPAVGPLAGGNAVTITGLGFTGTSGVTFNGVAATNVNVVNATTITVTAPAGNAGAASVVVTTPGGASAANSLYGYGTANVAPGFSLPVSAGGNWTARENDRYWKSIVTSADGTKLAAVADGGQIHTSTDGGLAWTARENARSWSALTCSADGSKLAAVVLSGSIHTSTDGGATWTARMTDFPRRWRCIASSADGSTLVAGEDGGYLYTSADSGATWTPRDVGDYYWQSVTSSTDGVKLAAVDRTGKIYTSSDSGVNWTLRVSGSSSWWSITSSADGTMIAAVVLNGTIYTSTNSGVSWTARESVRNWKSITSSADGIKLAAVADRIYTSTDSGVTWTAADSNRAWESITSSADGSKLAAATIGGQIYTNPSYGLTVSAGSGLSTLSGFATNISPGPVSEAGQTVTFQLTTNNNALFTTLPAISSNGTLTFTPGNSAGVATVTVVAQDSGGTAFGGSDTSGPQTFTITIQELQSPIGSWRQTYFGITSNTGNAADDFDFDQDGLNNLLEYALVLSPAAMSSAPSGAIFTYPEGQRLRMFLSRDPARTDVNIEVQALSGLTGTWATIATSAFGAPFTGPGYVGGDSAGTGVKTVEIRDTVNIADSSNRFLRVRVTR